MAIDEKSNSEHEEDLLDLLTHPGGENVRHWINYAKGANYFFTKAKHGNVSELYEKVCYHYNIHPAFQVELDKAREGVEKSFEIQEMLKEKFGFTQKKYFKNKKGLMDLIYKEQPKDYYSAKTHSFALLLNLPTKCFKEKSQGFVNTIPFSTLDLIYITHDSMLKEEDYIPTLDSLCIKYNAFNQDTIYRNKFFDFIPGGKEVVPNHELKHIIDGLLDKLNLGECCEFSAALYSEGPNRNHLYRDLKELKKNHAEIEEEGYGELDYLNMEIENLENFPFDLLGKIRKQGVSYRDFSFIISLHNAFSLQDMIEGMHDYLAENPIDTKSYGLDSKKDNLSVIEHYERLLVKGFYEEIFQE